MEISLVALSLVMALAYANGTNDVSKAIATLVGSGVTDYRTAIIWGTIWTMAGAGLSGNINWEFTVCPNTQFSLVIYNLGGVNCSSYTMLVYGAMASAQMKGFGDMCVTP